MRLALCLALVLGGLAAAGWGLWMQRAALKRYGSPSAPRGFVWNPLRLRIVWRAHDWFSDPRGLHLARRAEVANTVGLTAVIAGLLLHWHWFGS